MNVLITGGAGYIGSHVAVCLAQAGYVVFLYDNLSNSSASVLDALRRITGQQIALVTGDVADTGHLSKVMQRYGIEAVIHMAGRKAVAESVSDPLTYYHHNVRGTISLLQAMQASKVRRLVFSSSATVYGIPQRLPIAEDHPTAPTSPYGRTKLHVEHMLRDLADSAPDWGIMALRYFNPIGAHESGLISDSPRGTPNNLMPYIVQVATGKRERLTVYRGHNTPDGTGIRDYIHVCDVADGHLAALNWLESRQGFWAINLGTGRGHSVLEVVSAFESATGRQVAVSFAPARPGDVDVCYADPSMAQAMLGWAATRSLGEMCRSAWAAVK